MDLNAYIASAASGAQPSVVALFQAIFDLFWRLTIDRIKTLRALGAKTPLIQFRLGAFCVVRLVELHLTLKYHPERFTKKQLLPLLEVAPILERITGVAIDFSPLNSLAKKTKIKFAPSRSNPKSEHSQSEHPQPAPFVVPAVRSSPSVHAVHAAHSVHEVSDIPDLAVLPDFSEDADLPSMTPTGGRATQSAYTILETLYPYEGPIRCTAWTAPGESLAELCTLVNHLLHLQFPPPAPKSDPAPQQASQPQPPTLLCENPHSVISPASEIPHSTSRIPHPTPPAPT